MSSSSARPPVIVYTSCMGDGVSYLLEQSPDFIKRYRVARYISHRISDITTNTPILNEDHDSCNVFIHHPADAIGFTKEQQRDAYDAVLPNLPAATRKIEVPLPHFFAFWPFHAPDLRERADGGALAFPYGDSYVINSLRQGIPHEE